MSPQRQRQLKGLTLRHLHISNVAEYNWPDFIADHPMRFPHPRTGKPLLLVTEHHADRVLELGEPWFARADSLDAVEGVLAEKVLDVATAQPADVAHLVVVRAVRGDRAAADALMAQWRAAVDAGVAFAWEWLPAAQGSLDGL